MTEAWKRALALILALMLVLPGLVLAEDDAEGLILPDSAIGVEELETLEDVGVPELDVEGLDDLGLSLDLDAQEALEIPDALALDDAAAQAPGQADGALADNAGETVSVKYIDAKGKEMGPVTCTKVKSGDENRYFGTGWYAVTDHVSFGKGPVVNGDANLILCDGTSFVTNDGIWVQEKASLTIWAQSTGKKMGILKASGYAGGPSFIKGKAGIGGIEDEVAGAIIINGGDILARSGGLGSAAIGGGHGTKSGFTRIEINGGHIVAKASPAQKGAGCGIGAGIANKNFGDITITGGRVEAIGDKLGSGIGCNMDKN